MKRQAKILFTIAMMTASPFGPVFAAGGIEPAYLAINLSLSSAVLLSLGVLVGYVMKANSSRTITLSILGLVTPMPVLAVFGGTDLPDVNRFWDRLLFIVGITSPFFVGMIGMWFRQKRKLHSVVILDHE